MKSFAAFSGLICCCVFTGWVAAQQEPSKSELQTLSKSDEFQTVSLRGRVVWLADGLKELFDVSTVPEARERTLALETEGGELYPIVENLRGRAFRKDERLRKMDLEVIVRQHRKQPFVQVLRMYEISEGKKFEVDYWCDVCAIPMYETGPCACCQDHNRLRHREVEEASPQSVP